MSLGGQLATVGQLYLAWRAGLDSCAPGWLSDGSVRYPVAWPRPECGGSQPGVHTVTPNATADNTTALYDAYCYRGINLLFSSQTEKKDVTKEINGHTSLQTEALLGVDAVKMTIKVIAAVVAMATLISNRVSKNMLD